MIQGLDTHGRRVSHLHHPQHLVVLPSIARLILIAGIDLLAVDVGIKVAAMLGIAVTEACSGKV